MIIKVKLFAMLRERLPPDSNGEEVDLEVSESVTARDIITQLKIPEELARLVMVNGYHLLPAEIEHRVLKAGEVVAIFPPVAGG